MSASERRAIEQALVHTTLELARIPSVTGDEREICDHVEHRLLQHLDVHEVIRHGHSLIATPGPRRAGVPTVALLGHLDTVPPRQEGPVRLERGRIHGCGVSDMKAGVAVMLELLERLDPAELGVDLTYVFYEREEGPYVDNGLHPLLEHVPAMSDIDLAFCLEPSDNRLQLGSLGGIHCTLYFSGQRAHSARPWQGVNAVHKAGPLLAELHARGRHPVDIGDLTFYEVMSVTMVEATGTRNVVPDHLALNLNYRFAPGRSLESAQADIEALVAGRCEIEWTDLSPSGRVCLDNPLLAPMLDDPEVTVQPKQAWTDVARLSLFGIDAGNLGPGESAQAHQKNESCAVSLIVAGYHLFERYLRGL